MDRFNRVSGRVVRLEVDVQGFDLGRSTQAFRKRQSQPRQATHDKAKPPQPALRPTSPPHVPPVHKPIPHPHVRPQSRAQQAPDALDMEAEMVVFGDKQKALAEAEARLAPFTMEL